ncbi:molybdopterin-guanine dinucleotide biosynthesis protein B [Paenibacillus thermotolerans]|uniref:molybdopterin-guanine dinucleotide biosynthesis protein B n=1 Tax=Paenibacillus thermotolerans TaxID=3027807 RepID=UPI002367DE10|nr:MULTISPECIES: molybdopterin-guanine dinucleotide biosynthesis protein B [unclassified Paenibacillus]
MPPITVQGRQSPAVVQVVGYKNTGKTTLVCSLVEAFAAKGVRVGTVKHDAHDFDPDVPGTDSWKHRHAGARWSAVASKARTAFFEERETELEDLLQRMREAELVLVEGYKRKPYPKLVLIHSERDLPILDGLSAVLAVVTWDSGFLAEWAERLERERGVRVVRFDDSAAIAGIVGDRIGSY